MSFGSLRDYEFRDRLFPDFTLRTSIISAFAPRVVQVDRDHAWGFEIILENNELYCGKFLVLTNGERSSFHFHLDKDETFMVLAGIVRLEVGNLDDEGGRHIEDLRPGMKYRIDPGRPHSFCSTNGEALILEVSTHHDVSDTYRIDE